MNILNLERSKKSSPAGLYVYLDQVKILDQLPELFLSLLIFFVGPGERQMHFEH